LLRGCFITGSRLGIAAGVFGMVLGWVLWAIQRRHLEGAALWPLYLAVVAALAWSVWYGLSPFAARVLDEGIDSQRWQVWGLMLTEFIWKHWLFGLGLGGYEAAFKAIQTADIMGWYNFAHSDLLQWLVEMGAVGAAAPLIVLVAIVRRWRLETMRTPVYAGLAAIAMVALGDFSWHAGATQVVIAVLIGVTLRPGG
jgi:O-antigen ligase